MMELKSYDEMNAEQKLAYKMGAASLTPADVLAAVRNLPGVRETWMCEYPEFNDPACYVGHPDPKPEDAHPASKHLNCRWVLVVPLSPRTTNPNTFRSSPPDLDRLREAVGTVAAHVDSGDHVWTEAVVMAEALAPLLSLAGSGGRLVVEAPCEHGELEPHGWVCGAHDTDEKCPRQNCEAHLDFGNHCAGLHRNNDTCWSASACGGGSRRQVFPNEGVEAATEGVLR